LQESSSSLEANQIKKTAQQKPFPWKEAMPYEETITAAQQQQPDYSVTMDETRHNVKQFEAKHAKPADSTSAAEGCDCHQDSWNPIPDTAQTIDMPLDCCIQQSRQLRYLAIHIRTADRRGRE
jgi:hypothetical protein